AVPVRDATGTTGLGGDDPLPGGAAGPGNPPGPGGEPDRVSGGPTDPGPALPGARGSRDNRLHRPAGRPARRASQTAPAGAAAGSGAAGPPRVPPGPGTPLGAGAPVPVDERAMEGPAHRDRPVQRVRAPARVSTGIRAPVLHAGPGRGGPACASPVGGAAGAAVPGSLLHRRARGVDPPSPG